MISLETDHSAEIEINHIEAGEIATDKMIDKTIIGKIVEGIITETVIGQIMEEAINRDIQIGVKVGRIPEIIKETIQEKDLREVEIGIEIA